MGPLGTTATLMTTVGIISESQHTAKEDAFGGSWFLEEKKQ